MTWQAFHDRAEVLRAVIAEADRRRDGRLPMHVPGVAETFGDASGLVAALQLRWHTRLSGTIERELVDDPFDLERSVINGWRRAAAELPGVRALLDAQADAPASPEVAEVLGKARRKEWAMLAALAGKASLTDDEAAAVGRALEERARAGRPVTAGGAHRAAAPRARHRSLVSRLRAHLAA